MIELKNVYKSYKTGSIKRKVLNDIDLTIKEKEIIIILGASGSGKTTLLNCISGLDKIDSRKNSYIKFEGKDISKYSDFKMTKFRKKNLGFIFQTYNLLEHLNVRENILVGAKLGKRKIDMNELLDAIIQKLKDEGGELPDIHLIAMELVATSEDGIECRVQGSQLTKDLLEDLEISNEELDRMLRPAAVCLKEFAEILIERMEKKDEERKDEILDKLLKILN